MRVLVASITVVVSVCVRLDMGRLLILELLLDGVHYRGINIPSSVVMIVCMAHAVCIQTVRTFQNWIWRPIHRGWHRDGN